MSYKVAQYKGFKIIHLTSGEIKIIRGHVRMFKNLCYGFDGRRPMIDSIASAKDYLYGYTTHFPVVFDGRNYVKKYPNRTEFQS